MENLQAIAEHLATSVDFWIGVGLLLMFLGLCSVVRRVRGAFRKPQVRVLFQDVPVPDEGSIWRKAGEVRTVQDTRLKEEPGYHDPHFKVKGKPAGVSFRCNGENLNTTWKAWGEWVSDAERIA